MSRSIHFAGAALLIAAGLGLRAAARPPEGSRSGVDLAHVDPKVRAQDDLFRHVNGKWLAEATIPADRSADGAFYKLRETAEADIRAIIEEVGARADNPAGSEARKVGDLFASFMDEAAVDRLGVEPIRAELAEVDAIADKPGLTRTLARLQKTGTDGAFGIAVETDARQSDRYILYVAQGGLGLPDESYYRLDSFKPQREAYRAHVRRMFELAGRPDPAGSAEQVLALETLLAENHWDRVKSRDSVLTYNKKDLKGLAELTPGFDWPAWFEAAGAPGVAEVVVAQPSYFEAMARALDEVPLPRWKSWLAWSVLRNHAPLLSKPFVDEHFSFYGKTLTGAQEIRPRWKRGVGIVEGGTWRGGRQALRREAFPAGRQGPDGEAGGQPDRGVPPRHRVARMDGPGDQEEGVREARQVHAQDRLSGQVARLLGSGDPPRRPGRQRPAVERLRVGPPARQARQAG